MALPEYDAPPESLPSAGVPPAAATASRSRSGETDTPETSPHLLPPIASPLRRDAKSPIASRFVFAAVLLLSALYVAKGLKRGWFPWDEGILAQSADAVLHGALPHRDYFEIYTGGLSYLNAAAFWLFGTNLASMRYMLFLFFLAWVPAFYYVARRFVSAPVAGAITFLAVAWSVPNWPASMPSWYNLFFATFGLAALLHYIENPKPRWLLLAGLCGGTSCVFKVSGLYFVASVLLFLLFRETVVPGTKPGSRHERTLYRFFLTFTVLLYETLVLLVLRKVANAATYPYFWLPNVAIGAAILWLEFQRPLDKSKRFFPLFRELLLFMVAVALPIGLFLIPYIRAGSLFQISHGVSGSIQQHLDFVNSVPSVMKFVVGIGVNLLLGIVAFMTGTRIAKAVAAVFWVAIPLVLFLARAHPYVDRAIWGTIWSFLPLIVVTGIVLLVFWSMRERLDPREQQKIFLVLSVCATANLIQFPFTSASYYCHVAPFAFLSAAALVSQLHAPPKWALIPAFCFCLLYVMLVITPGFVMNMGQQYRPDQQVLRLELPRAGGLRVDPRYDHTYEDLSVIIKQHARGEYTFAMPSCPEVYFLNDLHDASATLFRTGFSPSDLVRALHEHDVNVIVLKNDEIPFGAKVPPDFRVILEQEFPNRTIVGPFEVRWKS